MQARASFGSNAFLALVLLLLYPAIQYVRRHYHEQQEELYFVHSGRIAITFNDDATHELGPGGLARVDPPTIRHIEALGDEPAVLLVTGGKDGYVGRDGRAPEDD